VWSLLSVPQPPGAAGGTDIYIKAFYRRKEECYVEFFKYFFRNKGKEKK